MTKQQIENMRVLGMTFLLLHESQPDAKVNMMEFRWDNECGTCACHAGWFAVARNMQNGARFPDENFSRCYDYEASSYDMARFLGFEDVKDLETWAVDNPNLWGRKIDLSYGLFVGSKVFVDSPSRLNLKVIGTHWLKVADNCEAEL